MSRIQRPFSMMEQTEKELVSIACNGKEVSVLSIKADSISRLRYGNTKCKILVSVMYPGEIITVLKGRNAIKAIAPYKHKVNCFMRNERREKRRKERERRMLLMGGNENDPGRI